MRVYECVFVSVCVCVCVCVQLTCHEWASEDIWSAPCIIGEGGAPVCASSRNIGMGDYKTVLCTAGGGGHLWCVSLFQEKQMIQIIGLDNY